MGPTHFTAILPNGTAKQLWVGQPQAFNNPTHIVFDRTGRMLFSDASTAAVYQSRGENPTKLFNTPETDADVLVVDGANNIYISLGKGSSGRILAYHPDGTPFPTPVVTGLTGGPEIPFAFGPGGAWGTNLYVISNHQLLRLDSPGNLTTVGTGFDAAWYADMEFGPDDALYVSDFWANRILRIASGEDGGPDEDQCTLTISSTEGGKVVDPGVGSFSYPPGTQVYLEAEPDPGYVFTGWTGSYTDPCSPTFMQMDADHHVTANFEKMEGEWFFVHMTDVHVGDFYGSGAAYLRGAVDVINKMDPRPAFVLVSGDIAQHAYTPLLADSGFYKEYNRIMEHLDSSIGVWNVPGNHDRYMRVEVPGTPCQDDWFGNTVCFATVSLAEYEAQIGTPPYAFDFPAANPFSIIGLNSGQDVGLSDPIHFFCGTGLSSQDRQLLTDQDSAQPKIIFMHHPLKHHDAGWVMLDEDQFFLNYCTNASNNVQLVLAGHTHEKHSYDKNGDEPASDYPMFVQTPATVHGYYRIIRIKDGLAIPEAPSKIPDGKGTFMVTFDDGPFSLDDGRTKKIVDALKNVGGRSVKAGFFMVGCDDGCEDTGAPRCCPPDPTGQLEEFDLWCGWTLYEEGTKGSVHDNHDVVRMVKEAGHLIGNHTQHHIGLPNIMCWDQDDVEKEIKACEDELRSALGEEPAKFFRPPHLSDWPFVWAAADNLGYTIIGGELVSDWLTGDVSLIKLNALLALGNWSRPEPCILIFHDNGPSTADNIREILEYLISQGYRLVDFDPYRSVGRLSGG